MNGKNCIVFRVPWVVGRDAPCSTLHVPRPTPHARAGMTLIEVLAAMGILSLGLLGLAALLPIGQYTISKAAQADLSGNAGRAGLHDMLIRGMLANANLGTAAFVNDPSQPAGAFGGGVAMNSSLGSGSTPADDLIVTLPAGSTGRPVAAAGGMGYAGRYSNFQSVVPAPNNPNQCTVSVVACGGRGSSATSTIQAANFYDLGIGGGSVKLDTAISVNVNDWVSLCGTNANKPITAICYWYRVACVGDDGVSLTLVGPDWDTSYTTTLVTPGGVLGVYTTTVNLN